MIPTIKPIQSFSFDALDKSKMMTVEEKNNYEHELFKLDVSLIAVSAMASQLTSACMRVCDIIQNSKYQEWRNKYMVNHDYTTSMDVMTNCNSLSKQIRLYAENTERFLRSIKSRSSFDEGNKFEDSFISRIDVCDDELKCLFDNIRKSIKSIFNPYKPSDPVVLYALFYALFISYKFDSYSRYFRNYANEYFGSGMVYAELIHFNVRDILRKLLVRCELCDWRRIPFVFLFTPQDSIEYEKKKQKKSWQIKHKDQRPISIESWRIFDNYILYRYTWELNRTLLCLKNIDKIITLAEGNDPEYRKEYKIKCIHSGIEWYEQCILNNVILTNRWSDVPRRVLDYFIRLKEYKDKTKRNIIPVVCYKVNYKSDVNDKDKRDKSDYSLQFVAVFNSAYEASIEWGVPWLNIVKSVRCNGKEDGCGNAWISFNHYLHALYSTLLKSGKEDIAHKLNDVLKEYCEFNGLK